VYRSREPHYIISPIDLPVTSRVTGATRARPFLGIRLELDLATMRAIASHLDRMHPVGVGELPTRAIFIGAASDRMIDATRRLCELFETPDDAPVVAPLVVRELVFHALKGPDGAALRQLVRVGTATQRIADVIYRLQGSLDETVDIARLARAAGMSRAAFFRRFKEATAMSPLQYQKRLRLLEARRLLVDEGEGAETAAFRVGYASASQFSRDYARMFGEPPLRDARSLRGTARISDA
jgi:AraC-like DNA-binding protein